MLTNFGILLVYIKIKRFVIVIPCSTYYIEDLIRGFIDLFDLIGWKRLKKEEITRNGLMIVSEILRATRNTGRYDLVNVDVSSKKEERVHIKIKVI